MTRNYMKMYSAQQFCSLQSNNYIGSERLKMFHSRLTCDWIGLVWHLLSFAILTFFTGVVAVASSSECDVFGTCSQLCSDTQNGSHKCSCLEGFQLGQDNRSCTLIDPQWKIIYITTTGISCISNLPNGTERKTNLSSRDWNPSGATYDARSNEVYWTDVSYQSKAIYRTNMSNKSVTKVANIGLPHPKAIAFDWITANIYFTDSTARHIGVCRRDKDECVVVVKAKIPWDIALHPNQGLMFWTVWGEPKAIFRAGIEGSFVLKIISGDLPWPNGIVVDQGNSRIFWADGSLDRLESSRFDGSDRRVVISSGIRYPRGIDILGDRIFWGDWRFHDIKSASKYNSSNVVTHEPEDNVWVNDLALMHVANQPILRSNPCQRAGKCSHICTLSPIATEIKCFCPVGMILGNDNRTCVESQELPKLFVAFRDTIKSMTFNAIGKNVFKFISLRQIKSISDFIYNPVNHTLIISDTATKNIYEYRLNSKQLDVLVNSHLDMVIGMDIDAVGENLYWIDTGKKIIEAMALRTGARTVVLTEVEQAFDILVVSETGYLDTKRVLVVHCKKGSKRRSQYLQNIFERRHHDGFSTSKGTESGKILWADRVNGSIELISLEGNSSSSLLVGQNVSSDLVIYKFQLFWVDIATQELKFKKPSDREPRSIPIGLANLNEHSLHFNMTGDFQVKMTVVDRDLSYLREVVTQHDCSRGNPRRKQCSHVCLLTGEEFVGECRCPEGLILDEDGVTCKETSTCDERNCTFICPQSLFKCATLNHCIVPSFVCDGDRDCQDGSDELPNCDRSTTTCSPEQFACSSGKCIDAGLACDGVPNCDDNEDEIDCELPASVEGGISDIISTSPIAPEEVETTGSGGQEENDDELKFVGVVIGSIFFILFLAGVIALVLDKIKKREIVLEDDLFQL